MDTIDPTVQYDLAFEARERYLYAYVSGEHDSFEISAAYWSEIARELKEQNIDKVLIVEDIIEQSPVADIYNLSVHLVDMGFRGVKIAFVDRHSGHEELNEFGVLVGSNRGLIAQAFNDETAAEKWLLAN